MLETLDDIYEHDKKIGAIRTLLEQVHIDFYENDKDGDGKDIESIGFEEMDTICAIENQLDDLELLSKKRYVKIIKKYLHLDNEEN